jgi:sugar O-acyltransferase (sialic acid O-acetyltransferase NeuD family)
MKKILLIGGGGHCKSVIDVIEQGDEFQIIGIVDKPELLGTKVLSYPIIGNDSDLANLAKKYHYALVTVGRIKSPALRIKLFDLAIKSGFVIPFVISPRAYVSKHAVVSKGTVVMHDALINAHAKIGQNCIINSKALIEHDAIIEDHCHISTASVINGGTTVKANTFYGSNATSREYVKIGGFIKAGSVVT